jgi:hypothetical protein
MLSQRTRHAELSWRALVGESNDKPGRKRKGRDLLNPEQAALWDAVPLIGTEELKVLLRRIQAELRTRKSAPPPPWTVADLDRAMAKYIPEYAYPANGVGLWAARAWIDKMSQPYTWAGQRVEGVTEDELENIAKYLAQDEGWMKGNRTRTSVMFFLSGGGMIKVRKWAKNRRAYY